MVIRQALGDEITVTVRHKKTKQHQIVLDCHCIKQRRETIISGLATIIAPTIKVKRKRVELPEIEFKKIIRPNL
ncbi:hypothetical protein [Legionella santicrucis]|uniref:hypothetical protein n=1 Tax=Legionella santicrucis TaxID=45074 RepID=UPI000731AC1A|nr:hypothetical protein [Legionella santicrucis]